MALHGIGESDASGRIVEIGLLEAVAQKDKRRWSISRIFKKVKKVTDWLPV